jgi:hypothetical protein
MQSLCTAFSKTSASKGTPILTSIFVNRCSFLVVKQTILNHAYVGGCGKATLVTP